MNNPLPEPHLDPEELRNFEKGVAEFNAGYYFECHDTLEDVWNGVRGPARDFFQGLIQMSVGFYHITNGNLAGAESMFGRALKRLERYPERYFGFDLAQIRGDIQACLTKVRAKEVDPVTQEQLPKWRFDREAVAARGKAAAGEGDAPQ